MPAFRPVDPEGRVWLVEDLLPPHQAEEIVTTDWNSLPWTTGALQSHLRRKHIRPDHPTVTQLSGYISNRLPMLNQVLGTDFSMASGSFWVDQPGFKINMHTDGELPMAMQLYWIMPGPEWGTGFYQYNNKNSLWYQFISRPNSGYIMLNHPNPDGSQPLLWHGMFNPVPEGTVRVSSYWYFA
jgi:hypothetical protein